MQHESGDKMLKPGINKVTNEEYHADTNYFSSSSFKLLMTDLPKFYREKILHEVEERAENPNFSEGSYVHSMLLEPERVAEEYAFFEGWRKAGKEWEAFKAQHPDKTILSKPQQHRCQGWVASVERRREALALLQGGIPEHTICGTWKDIPVKIRCDYINVDQGYIVDIKTTGYPADADLFKRTIREYYYQLSAALYKEVASTFYKKNFDFYFIVISKPESVCDVYKMSEETMQEGYVYLTHAANKYIKAKGSNLWTEDELNRIIETGDYEIVEV